MRRVLLLSDRPAQIQSVDRALRLDGHVLRTEASAERCLTAVHEWRPALLLLDVGMGLSSSVLSSLLAEPAICDVAVVAMTEPREFAVLSAVPSVSDFVVAPVDEDELRLRVARLLALNGDADGPEVLRCGGLEIDIERYKVTVQGDVVDLTYKEYELLRFLASNPGKPFTREALLNQVWGYDYYGGSRTVDVHVRRIRAKIERYESFVETVRNVGYRFTDAK
ncbi:MAG: response regulator transcription factor [Dehalococcoidia bacterium]|nr:response regulator transcription factor [Dehalococcoidia bacterium]